MFLQSLEEPAIAPGFTKVTFVNTVPCPIKVSGPPNFDHEIGVGMVSFVSIATAWVRLNYSIFFVLIESVSCELLICLQVIIMLRVCRSSESNIKLNL